MSEKDKGIIEEAYSTSYRSTIMRLLEDAESDECREALHYIMCDPEIEWED